MDALIGIAGGMAGSPPARAGGESARLPWRFRANVRPPYWVVLRRRHEPAGWVAEVLADVRDDSRYQLDRPFGDPRVAPREDEPYQPWRRRS